MVRWRTVKSLWNRLDEGCLLMPSLGYLMADRGIHAGTRRERQRAQWLVLLNRQLTHPHILSLSSNHHGI